MSLMRSKLCLVSHGGVALHLYIGTKGKLMDGDASTSLHMTMSNLLRISSE